MDSLTDLIEKCCMRPANEEAWEEFVRRFQPMIRHSIENMYAGAGEFNDSVEDLVQTIYYRLVDNRSEALQLNSSSDEALRIYLIGLSRQVVKEHWRAQMSDLTDFLLQNGNARTAGAARTSGVPRLRRPPGLRLLKIADFVFSPKSVSLTFAPLVADWHHEYFGALRGGRLWKGRWICVRYHWAFAKAFGLSKVFDAVKGLLRIPSK